MKYTLSQKLDKPTLARFFKDVWDAEVFSDVDALYRLFQNVWENIDEDPSFEDYEDVERAQFFRYCGYFLSHYGQARNIPFYQERGKNLLTKAIDLFYSLDFPERALEAEIVLGLCYFYEGAIAESETIFEDILSKFGGNHLNPLYLRTLLNSTMVLQWKSEYQKALNIIEEIEIPMEFCQDKRLLTIYHTQAGLIYRGSNQFDRAIYHYNKCIEISQQENNWVVVGKNHNNLAFLYKTAGDLDSAHYHIEQAIHIFRGLNHNGLLPHILDTKAVIYLEEGKFEASLETIREAVSIFQKGDDYAGFVDTLWNKTKVFLNLNRKEEAIETFIELCEIARQRMGDYAVKRYSKLFAEIIYLKSRDSSDKEFPRFKTFEIIGTPRIQKESSVEKAAQNPKQINKLALQNVTFSFLEKNAFSLAEVETFYASAEIIADFFNIKEDVILAAAPFQNPASGNYILAEKRDKSEYIFSRILHDDSLDIFYLLINEEPFPLEELNIVKQVVGYCLFAEVDNKNLVFKPLSIS